MFYKIGVLKNFAEFTWKQLRSVTLIKKTPVQVLSCEFCEIFKNPFWENTSGRLLLDFFHSLNCFLPPSELIETRFFLFLNMFYHGFRTWWISRTLLRETDDLVVAAGKHISLRNRCFLGWLTYEHSYLYAYWIFVLHFPVILYLKFKEATTNVIHWFRGVL